MLIVFGFCFIVYLFENLFALNVTELNSFVLQGKTRFTSGSDLFYDYEELKQDVAFRMKVSWFNESIVWGQTQTGQRFKLINRSESIQCLPIDTFDMIPMFFAVELATTEYPNALAINVASEGELEVWNVTCATFQYQMEINKTDKYNLKRLTLQCESNYYIDVKIDRIKANTELPTTIDSLPEQCAEFPSQNLDLNFQEQKSDWLRNWIALKQ